LHLVDGCMSLVSTIILDQTILVSRPIANMRLNIKPTKTFPLDWRCFVWSNSIIDEAFPDLGDLALFEFDSLS